MGITACSLLWVMQDLYHQPQLEERVPKEDAVDEWDVCQGRVAQVSRVAARTCRPWASVCLCVCV